MTLSSSRYILVLGLLCASGCRRAVTEKPDLVIAAAADLRFAMDDIAREFQKQHPEISVKTAYGSSGQLYQQIQNGAPFDVYCSADHGYPRKLEAEGLALPDSEFLYAVGRLAIWVPTASPLPVEKLGIQSLLDPSIRHIAIANPEYAPYGKAAVAALTTLGVYAAVTDKLVYGENISQTVQYVETGSADVGIVSSSLVHGTGRSYDLPVDSYPKMEQGGIIVKSTKNAALAMQFRALLVGAQGRAILKNFGFALP